MLDQAITKINTEIQEKNQKHVTVVGEFLKDYLMMDSAAAEKIMDEQKSITESIKVMRDEARKQAVDNVSVLTKEEGFEIVLKYYDIEPVDPKEVEENNEFDVKLDDFL